MGVETYITAMFWLGLFAVVVRLLTIGCADYPRKTTYSMGVDIVGLVIGGFMFAWVCFLKFGA